MYEFECGRAVNESLFFRRDKNHHVAQTPKKIMWNEKWKIKDKIIFAWEAERSMRKSARKNCVSCNIYEMISLVYLQCRTLRASRASTPWKNEIENEKSEKNLGDRREQWTRASSSSRYFNLYLHARAYEHDGRVYVRAVSEPKLMMMLYNAPLYASHILEAPNWQPIWKIFIYFM